MEDRFIYYVYCHDLHICNIISSFILALLNITANILNMLGGTRWSRLLIFPSWFTEKGSSSNSKTL